MTRFRNVIIILLTVCILSVSRFIFAAGIDEQYARYLFSHGYFEESERTYLFLQYYAPDAAHKNYYLYWMGRSQFEKRDFSLAEKTFENLISENKFLTVSPRDVYFEYLRSLYFQKKFFEVSFEIENGKYKDDMQKISEMNGWCAINTSDWNKAGRIFSGLAAVSDEKDRARLSAITDIINNRSDYKQKSPLLAGFLSAVLPGAGHLYAGNLTNAVGAFMLNAVFGSLTAYSAYKKQWVYTAFFGIMEVGFYSGSIVSAYQEAKYHNTKKENDWRLTLSAYFPFRIGN